MGKYKQSNLRIINISVDLAHFIYHCCFQLMHFEFSFFLIGHFRAGSSPMEERGVAQAGG